MADAYSCRPSDLLGVDCEIQSFYLDRACWMFGTKLDSQISQATHNAKNDVARQTAAHQVMNKALGDSGPSGKKQGPTKFRDPALM